MNRQRGIFIMEAMVGLVLITAIAAAFTVSVYGRRTINDRTNARLRAVDLAEASMLSLQAGQPIGDVKVTDLSQQGRWKWVRISATVDGETAELIGMVGGAQ